MNRYIEESLEAPLEDKEDNSRPDLVFVALGGLGEIGMNAALYGFGLPQARKWIMVDLGIGFAGKDIPGVDLILPDISFVEKIKPDLLGLLLTHAHEDHIGAVADLWPRLNCPVYASSFAAGLLELKRLLEPDAPNITVHLVYPGKSLTLGPFEIEFINMAHSIPESMALALRTPLGQVLHTGDWRIDPTPVVGEKTDEARLKVLGEEGILALVGDSTNILREGDNLSEQNVAQVLQDLIAQTEGRVAVTTFASNVARLRAVAEAAQKAGRVVLIVGRAMARVIQVAQECGYLKDLPEFLSADHYNDLPREKVVALVTGSQGETRAALSRIAENTHPDIILAAGDRVIFSSRTIPGNEQAVAKVVNGLILQGVEVITDRTHLVHVSGHPRRSEVQRLYEWVKPKIAIPIHGEPLHLAEHVAFARRQGVPHALLLRDGMLARLAPGSPKILKSIPVGRMYKDGDLLISAQEEVVSDRRALSHAGIISIGLAINESGDMIGEPDVLFRGIPKYGRNGKMIEVMVDEAIFGTFDSLPRQKRRDANGLSNAVERAVRSNVKNAWGKRPIVHVLVVVVERKDLRHR